MLTKENYFTTENNYISNSKLGDWLKDKNYFYKKNVTGEITRDISDPMIIGSAVDMWIMEGEKAFRNKYIMVSRRSKKQPDYEYQLNPTMFNCVEKLATNIIAQDAYKELEDFTSQKILQVDKKIGMFDGLCGIPDWFKVDGKSAIIVDLKTAEDANQQKYFYKCRDYGYFRQMAFYAMLINEIYDIDLFNMQFRHLVVEKDKLDINNCYTFEFAPSHIKEAWRDISAILADISSEKEFAPHNASWDNAVII